MHTINQMFDRFEADEMPKLGERTSRDYGRHIARLRQQFGRRKLKELSRTEILSYMKVSKGPISRNRALSVLSSAISDAVEWGWVDSNVCKGVPRNKPSRKGHRELTQQEFDDVKRIGVLRVRIMMDLARLTEQDQGMLLALRWTHVNDERNVMLFRHGITGEKIEVPITPPLRAVLDQCKKIRNGAYVVSRKMGGRYTSEGFRALWQRTMVAWDNTGNDRFTFPDIKRWAKKARKASAPGPVEDDIKEYPQFDEVTRTEAASMSRHYKVFYCLEQSIRRLITATMEKAHGVDWWNSGKIIPQIKQDVDLLVAKEIDSGMEQRSERMIDYTTFGQLSQIITQNWDVFGKVLTSPKAVGKVMASLNLLRGPIAHCCPMPEHEADRLAITVKDWFNIRL